MFLMKARIEYYYKLFQNNTANSKDKAFVDLE